MPELLSAWDTAMTLSAQLGVKVSAALLQSLAAQGCITSYTYKGKGLYFRLKDVEEFVWQHLIRKVPARRPYVVVIDPSARGSHPESVPECLAPMRDLLHEFPVAFAHKVGCVYFLLKDNEVVYVGQTTNLAARLAQHRENGKDFDRAVYLFVAEADLLDMEGQFIRAIRPRLNINGQPRPDEPVTA